MLPEYFDTFHFYQSTWGRSGTLGDAWKRFGDTLERSGTLWGRSGNALGTLRDALGRSGDALGILWGQKEKKDQEEVAERKEKKLSISIYTNSRSTAHAAVML